MQEFTVSEFQNDFDNLFSRVERGESFIIRNTDGSRCVIMPSKQMESTQRDLDYSHYFEHNEAS